MLPNRMQLSRVTEEQLKRLKAYTGLTPNIAARIAFFRSVEGGFRFDQSLANNKLDGSLVLDKVTWLGETTQATELILAMLYSDLEPKIYLHAWASHVEDGIASLRNHRSMKALSLNI